MPGIDALEIRPLNETATLGAWAPPVAPLRRESLAIPAAGGLVLALHRISGSVRYRPPVILTHGTFSNAQVCSVLAQTLALEGFDCFVLEWQGHGQSSAPQRQPDFEDLSGCDVPAALAAVRQLTGQRQALWVAHSGGALLALMHLARTRAAREEVAGLVALASQATDAGRTLKGRAQIVIGRLITAALGHLPGRLLRLGPENEFGVAMNQWFGWSWSGRWRGRDGFDYLAALKDLHLPALCISGAGDDFIAPVTGCQRLCDALGSTDKQHLQCGTATGFGEDYTHARLIASRRAREEVWPRLVTWLKARAQAA